jgi:hypothetical protein
VDWDWQVRGKPDKAEILRWKGTAKSHSSIQVHLCRCIADLRLVRLKKKGKARHKFMLYFVELVDAKARQTLVVTCAPLTAGQKLRYMDLKCKNGKPN